MTYSGDKKSMQIVVPGENSSEFDFAHPEAVGSLYSLTSKSQQRSLHVRPSLTAHQNYEEEGSV